MANLISQRIQEWSAVESGDIDFNAIHALIEFLSSQRYAEYGPTLGNYPEFRERLTAWLANTNSEIDQKLMFRLVPHIFFLGRARNDCPSAICFSKCNPQMDQSKKAGLALDTADFNVALQREIGRTWFCPITDSANITEFYHQNELTGEHRPDWRSFARLHGGNPAPLVQHAVTFGYQRIVLVEDIVGSGSQMRDIRPLLAGVSATLPVMIAPMIVCPDGAEAERANFALRTRMCSSLLPCFFPKTHSSPRLPGPTKFRSLPKFVLC